MRFTPILLAFVTIVGPLCTGCVAGEARTRPATVSPKFASIDGRSYQPLAVAPHAAAVVMFILQDCPICNAYAPEVQRLAAEFGPRDVPFYLVHVDPTLSAQDARKHARDYGYKLPTFIDRDHELVRRLGVAAVPTAVVLGHDGSIAYEGRIDDRFVALGQSRNAPTTHELRDALDAIRDGRPPPVRRTRVVGCAVPDLPDRR